MITPPHNIQIELVEGCNRMCPFCGIHGIWTEPEFKKIKKMETGLALKVADSLAKWWKKGKRVEFAMHGEPTLHPDIARIIKEFKTRYPSGQFQVTTNGLIILKNPELVTSLFKAGLNLLLVDTYVKMKELISVLESSGIPVIYYYQNDFNPYYFHNNKVQRIIIMDDIGKQSGKKAARKVLNHAGNVNIPLARKYGISFPPIQLPLRKKCSRVFREMVVHYDGTVPLCCMDWKHEFIVGKFPDDGTLNELWESDIFHIVRKQFMEKIRCQNPCTKCDYAGGFRIGLLNSFPIKSFSKDKELTILKNHFEKTKKYRHPAFDDAPESTGFWSMLDNKR